MRVVSPGRAAGRLAQAWALCCVCPTQALKAARSPRHNIATKQPLDVM